MNSIVLFEPKPNNIYNFDAVQLMGLLQPNSVNCIVTSPPYFGLRDYGVEGQIGLETTPDEYVKALVNVFAAAHRVLRPDGTLWLNLGDSYAGSGKGAWKNPRNQKEVYVPARDANVIRTKTPGLKPKDLIGIPWMVAFALQKWGWYLRCDIVWNKPNGMPSSVEDRPVRTHEYVFLLTKSSDYWYDHDAISEPAANAGKNITLGQKSFSKGQATGIGVAPSGNGKLDTYTVTEKRSKRSVWDVNTEPFGGEHFAVFPQKLIEPMILAGCPVDGLVLDPFMGAGTTALVARALGRNYIGSEINREYIAIANDRLRLPFERAQTVADNDVSTLPLFAAIGAIA